MFYKYNENTDNYNKGLTITLPSGQQLNESNKLELDGWEWFENPPQEYLDWKDRKELEHYQLLKELENK